MLLFWKLGTHPKLLHFYARDELCLDLGDSLLVKALKGEWITCQLVKGIVTNINKLSLPFVQAQSFLSSWSQFLWDRNRSPQKALIAQETAVIPYL